MRRLVENPDDSGQRNFLRERDETQQSCVFHPIPAPCQESQGISYAGSLCHQVSIIASRI